MYFIILVSTLIFTQADVVTSASRAFIGSVRMCVVCVCTCVCVYVSTLKQKPLVVSSPNLAGE